MKQLASEVERLRRSLLGCTPNLALAIHSDFERSLKNSKLRLSFPTKHRPVSFRLKSNDDFISYADRRCTEIACRPHDQLQQIFIIDGVGLKVELNQLFASRDRNVPRFPHEFECFVGGNTPLFRIYGFKRLARRLRKKLLRLFATVSAGAMVRPINFLHLR
jgi:hypothetical protein